MTLPKTDAAREVCVLAALAHADGFPISTSAVRAHILERIHPADEGRWVLGTLHRLAGQHRIERWNTYGLGPMGGRGYYWRR